MLDGPVVPLPVKLMLTLVTVPDTVVVEDDELAELLEDEPAPPPLPPQAANRAAVARMRYRFCFAGSFKGGSL